MKYLFLLALLLLPLLASAETPLVTVTEENFARAETDLYFSRIVAFVGVGKFLHVRQFPAIERQTVVRTNRDTFYSAGIFDLDAGPVTIYLPESGGRFQSLQFNTEDAYSPPAIYQPGKHTFTREQAGTRYVMAIVRILVNPADSADIAKVHALQDQIRWEQAEMGTFEIPKWDPVSQAQVRARLMTRGAQFSDSRGMFGLPGEVDPEKHLIGTAYGWGGNPEKDALYLMNTPPRNDGQTIYHLQVGEVPVSGFWSVSVYNASGYFEKNALNAYSLNSLTAEREPDGSVKIQFGGCSLSTKNCLPTMPGWNYWVRLYLPREEILRGWWKFPAPDETNNALH